MSPEQVLAVIDEGREIPGARVMRFRPTVVFLTATGQALLGLGIFAFMFLVRNHVNRPIQNVAYGFAAVAILLALSALWLAFRNFGSVLSVRSNVLVVLPTGVLRRLRHRVRFWSFEEFPSITVVQANRRQVHPFTIAAGDPGPDYGSDLSSSDLFSSVREIYLNERDGQFGETLIDDHSFGSPAWVLSQILPARRQFVSGR